MTANNVKISAHGGRTSSQNSTLESYKQALATDADYVEFDIRRTADDELVAHHDAVTNQGERLSQTSYRQLCRIAGYEVPRVSEILRLIKGRARGHLDLKEVGYEEVLVNLALDILGAGQFIVTSLEDKSVTAIKSRYKEEVPVALSLGRSLKHAPRTTWAKTRASELFPLNRISACGADWVALNRRLAQAGVLRECHRHGINAMVWTVNSDRDISRWLRDERVRILVTDRPGQAVTLRAETQRAEAQRS
jgi:glycerophosphoryl diester phosphodiesterase